MSVDNNKQMAPRLLLRRGCIEELHWVEVFKDRVAEELKAVLQDGMDWTTSSPILNLLNKLESVEADRNQGRSPNTESSRVAEQSADTARSR